MAEKALTTAEAEALWGTTGDSGYEHGDPDEDWTHKGARQERRLLDMARLSDSLRVFKDDGGALTFGVRAGRFRCRGAEVSVEEATNQSLADDATNYVYLTAAGALTVNTTGFLAAAHVPLATIATGTASGAGQSGGYAYTDITDRRGSAALAAVGRDELFAHRLRLAADCRNADGTVLDAAGGDGKFSIVAGGWGSGTLLLDGEDAQNETETTRLCFEAVLPAEYVASADVTVRVRAKVDDSGGGTVATKQIDCECYALDDDGAVGSDLCATAAQTLTDSFADCDFVVIDTDLAPGGRLMVLVETQIQETADGGTVKAVIGSIEVLADRVAP
jgi:hypothetical protein